MCTVCISVLLLVMDIGRFTDTKDVYFNIESNVNLTCDSNSSHATFFWRRDSVVDGYSCILFDDTINKNCKDFTRLVEEGAGQSIRIINTSNVDVGKYTCEITIQDQNEPKVIKTVHHLKVRIPPSNITIENVTENGKVHAIEGKRINLVCTVQSGKPKETLMWLHNDMVLRSDTINSSLKYTFIPKRTHDGQQYTCQATQTSFGSVKKTVTLVVRSKTEKTNQQDDGKLVVILICVSGFLFVCLVAFVIYHFVNKYKRGVSNQQRQQVTQYDNHAMPSKQETRYTSNTGKSQSIYVEVELNLDSDDDDRRFRIKGSYANLVQ